MKRLYLSLVGIILWFFLLYNIERLIAPINIASFVYVYAALIAIITLALPALNQWSSLMLYALVLAPFFLLKLLMGYEIAGQNLPITIAEMSALYFTLIIARRLGRLLYRVQDEIARLTVVDFNHGVKDFSDGQSEIYREVRRARRYTRPAALLIVKANGKSLDLAEEQIMDEIRESIARNHINARFANFLRTQLKFSDVITRNDDSFVILLAETTREQVPSVINRLERSASEELGLSLEIGFSSFPSEAVTFAGLLEQAEERLHRTAVQPEGLEGEFQSATKRSL